MVVLQNKGIVKSGIFDELVFQRRKITAIDELVQTLMRLVDLDEFTIHTHYFKRTFKFNRKSQ